MDWSFGNMSPDSNPPEAMIAAGVVIGGRYQVAETIGSGAQGEVLRARDLQLNRPVAVKLLKSQSDTTHERFLREGRLTAALTHPNVVNLLAGGLTERGRPFLVLELLEDPQPLDEFVRNQPLEERMRLFVDVCRGVGAAHAAGIVHRDLKPSNLLVDRYGHVRVCDFGLGVREDDVSGLTISDAIIGTPLYMSPESMLEGKAHRGPRQDVWALGVLLYQLLTDELPFESSTLTELYARITSGAKPPSAVRAIPRGLEQVCLRCLRMEPEERFPHAAAVAAAIQGAGVVKLERSYGRLIALGVAGVLCFAVWGFAQRVDWAVWSGGEEPLITDDVESPALTYEFPTTEKEYLVDLDQAIADRDAARLELLSEVGMLRGQPEAFYARGFMHDQGLGGEVDLGAAADNFRRAATGGSPRGIQALARAYTEGRGLELNLDEGLRLYERAAQLGSIKAHTHLGRIYSKGEGVEVDLARAIQHLLVAADKDPEAAMALCLVYFRRGEDQLAEPWLIKAAQAGVPQGMYQMGVLALERQKPTEALQWVQRSAEAGWDQAQCRMAAWYLQGDLLPKDLPKALEWAKKAAEHSALGAYNLGVFYNRGYGVEVNPEKAREQFFIAAEGGNVEAMCSAFHFLLEGRGGESNPIAAHRWLRLAAERGHPKSQGLLGKRLMFGYTPDSEGASKQECFELALPWLERCAARPSPEAWYNLGYCLAGMRRSREALAWLRRAAEAEYGPAYSTLADVLCLEGPTQDFQEAVRWHTRAGKRGGARSYVILGRLYMGEEAPKFPADYALAREHFRLAVELGHRGAMYRLADLLKTDQGGPIEIAEGRALLERALEEESADPEKDATFVEAIQARLDDYPPE